MKKLIACILVLAFIMCAAFAEEDKVFVTVNGDPIYQSELDSMVAYLTSLASSQGYDTDDETVKETIRLSAVDELVDDRLLTLDMTANGCYDFTEEEQSTIEYVAQVSLANLIAEYAAYFEEYYGSSIELGSYTFEDLAENYLASAGYTLSYMVNYYTNALASEKYASILVTVSDEEVQAEYTARVAESMEKYGSDAAAFETALYNNAEVWYRPEGYRAVLQVMMSAQGETDEEKLASVADKTSDICDRLARGESFEDMIRLYGEDTAFDTESFFETGYQVHKDSVIWEDAFVNAVFALENIGDVSPAVVLGDNVCILYYYKDVPGGAVELSDALAEALREDVMNAKTDEAIELKVAELKAAATIEYAD